MLPSFYSQASQIKRGTLHSLGVFTASSYTGAGFQQSDETQIKPISVSTTYSLVSSGCRDSNSRSVQLPKFQFDLAIPPDMS